MKKKFKEGENIVTYIIPPRFFDETAVISTNYGVYVVQELPDRTPALIGSY